MAIEKSHSLGKYRGLDTVQVAEHILRFRNEYSPDAVVVNGDGLGAGVVDQLRHRGYSKGLFEFHAWRTSPAISICISTTAAKSVGLCATGSTSVAARYRMIPSLKSI